MNGPRARRPSAKSPDANRFATRRTLLSALGATATAGIAGCIGDYPSASPAPETTEPGGSATTDTPETTTEGPSAEFVRCRGESVSVERTLTDEPGYEDDGREYFPENETIRYVAARSRGEPAKYETISFERWASIECASAASERAREATADRLDTGEFSSGTSVPPEIADTDEPVVRLAVSTKVEDGEVVSRPSVSRDQLADAAPRSVETTVSLAGEEFSRTVPVFAHHVKLVLE